MPLSQQRNRAGDDSLLRDSDNALDAAAMSTEIQCSIDGDSVQYSTVSRPVLCLAGAYPKLAWTAFHHSRRVWTIIVGSHSQAQR